MSEKNLDYFLRLPYRIELEEIAPDLGGGISVCIPALGRYSVHADGDTVQQALDKLEEIKRDRLEAYLEAGVSIPEPEKDEHFSGKFVLRIPKYLHKELSMKARQNNVSLNHLITSLLSRESNSLENLNTDISG